MRLWNLLLLCFACTLISVAAPTSSPDWDGLGKLWWSHIQFLADDSLEGRDTGSQGFEKAANYMAEQFRAAGLEPAGVDGYRQPMDFQVVKIDESRCSLDLLQDGKMLPPAILRAKFAGLGVTPDKSVVTSCGSGVTAAVLTLGLAVAGLPQGALYDGSWSEWGGRNDTPIEV